MLRQAWQRLAPFTGLHFTPADWLHMATLVAGHADQFSGQQVRHMVKIATDHLANIPPITVTLGKIIYHREAIMLAATPADALAPIHSAAARATGAVTGSNVEPSPS
ncbi:MAG: hypothetical protein J2P28_01910 [Actinobacteria bacterium]|nr:hypothetical protein [Actinomycetota bacterium]